MAEYRGKKRAGSERYLVVVSRFNRWITSRLLTGARRELAGRGVKSPSVDVVWVPGSFELAQAGKLGALTGDYGAVICLGAIIRGETSHDVHIANACARGIQESSLVTGVPFAFGVITAGTVEHALARSRTDAGRNMGADAAGAAVEMATLLGTMRRH